MKKGYGNEPFFINKANASKHFLEQNGLPSQFHEDYMKQNLNPLLKDRKNAKPDLDENSLAETVIFRLEVDKVKLEAERDLITKRLANNFHLSYGTMTNLRKRKTAIKKELENIKMNLDLLKK